VKIFYDNTGKIKTNKENIDIFIRALVLYYHRGLWLDADVLIINHIKPLLEDLNTRIF
jgi:mannosyltransferase OCH1-like enzyme